MFVLYFPQLVRLFVLQPACKLGKYAEPPTAALLFATHGHLHTSTSLLCLVAQRLCRGRNVEGQCAIEGPVPLVTRPTAVLELLQAPVSSVVASKLTSGAVVGGAVYTWGEGAAGKLGHGSAASLTVPSRVSLCVQLNCATAAGPLFGTANTSCQARVPACAAVLWDRGSGPCCAALSPAGLPACCCFLQAPTCKRPPWRPCV